jgi:hypothetical protein
LSPSIRATRSRHYERKRFISCLCLGREPPHPDAESAENDNYYYAHPHRGVMRSDNDSGMIDQPQEVTESKERENNARHA